MLAGSELNFSSSIKESRIILSTLSYFDVNRFRMIW
jgi:hypothetical protein